jgi:hypothetical protein
VVVYNSAGVVSSNDIGLGQVTSFQESNGWIFAVLNAFGTTGILRIKSDGRVDTRLATLGLSVTGCEALSVNLVSVMCASKSAPTQLLVSRLNGPVPTRPNGDVLFVGVEPLSATSLRIKWKDEVSDEVGFLVYRQEPGGTVLVPGCSFTVANLTQCDDTGLIPNVYYYYYVYAWNGVGTTSPGSYMLAHTASLAPAAPTATAAVATGPNSVRVDWLDNSTNEAGFNVYRYTSGGTFNLDGVAPANATSLTVTNPGLNSAVATVFVVSAINGSGETNAQDYLYSLARTPPGGAGPTPPSYLPTVVSSTSAQINWTDNATNEVGYLVYRVGGGPTVLVPGCSIVTANLTSCTDTGLTPGTYYQYYVYAWNNTGTGYPGTAEIVHTPNPLRAPEITSAYSLFPRISSYTTSSYVRPVTLNWKDLASDETGYRVLTYVDGAWAPVPGGDLPPNTTTFTDLTFDFSAPVTHVYTVLALRGSESVYAPFGFWATTQP